MARPTQRSILENLKKARLVEIANGFELGIAQSQAKAEFVDAIARSKKASFENVLAVLSRDELKDICRAHELDDSGKAKQVIIDRILGRESDAPAAKPKAVAKKRGSKGAAAEVDEVELPTNGKLTVSALEKYLWSAADILRGSIDSSDYKSFIFGMLFLKRLSDRFEEEAEKLIADGEDAEVAWEDRDYHQFFVPPQARWSALQQKATNVGEALNKACAKLEEENDSLEGVLLGPGSVRAKFSPTCGRTRFPALSGRRLQ